MGKLRVNYQALEEITIPELAKCERDIGCVYDSMQDAVSSLLQYMSADTAASYIDEFAKIVGPSVANMEELVREYRTQLKQVAEQFADVDASIAKQIGVD